MVSTPSAPSDAVKKSVNNAPSAPFGKGERARSTSPLSLDRRLPQQIDLLSRNRRGDKRRSRSPRPSKRDRRFESGSLQQRVCELSVPERVPAGRIRIDVWDAGWQSSALPTAREGSMSTRRDDFGPDPASVRGRTSHVLRASGQKINCNQSLPL